MNQDKNCVDIARSIICMCYNKVTESQIIVIVSSKFNRVTCGLPDKIALSYVCLTRYHVAIISEWVTSSLLWK